MDRKKPSLNHFKVWGCPVEVKIYDPSLKKTDSRTTRCYFIWYPSHSKRYKIYCSTRGTRVVESQVTKFLELDVAKSIPSQSTEIVEPMDFISLPLPASDVNLDARPFDSGIQQGVATIDLPIIEITPIANEIPPVEVRRSQKTRKPAISNDYYVYLEEGEHDIGEEVTLITYSEALNSDKVNKWLIAMGDEMQSMLNMMFGNLLIFPKDISPLDANWYSRPKETTKGMLKYTRPGWLLKGIHNERALISQRLSQ